MMEKSDKLYEIYKTKREKVKNQERDIKNYVGAQCLDSKFNKYTKNKRR